MVFYLHDNELIILIMLRLGYHRLVLLLVLGSYAIAKADE